ncbi:MAG: triose-phosphate isomerase [Acidimicrobiales bacterium]
MSDAGDGRRPLISANWKMNLDHHEALHAIRDLGLRLRPADVARVDASVHPAFTAIRTVQSLVEPEGIPVALGAQNCAVEDSGAFTGEVGAPMLAKLHVEYVIVGHSERRRLYGETDDLVLAKVKAVLRNDMTPICCVGETEDERELGLTNDRLSEQVRSVVGPLAADAVAGMVIAYEPVWAIGTGQSASPDDAEQACGWIREVVAGCAGAEAAGRVRIQYGGSVQEENTEALLTCPNVDGALVGGASLDAAAFTAIIRAATLATG